MITREEYERAQQMVWDYEDQLSSEGGMNVLSLFDGISCGQVALKKCGIEIANYFASEIDKYANKVNDDNYPDTIQLGDVTKIKAKDLEKIDLIVGGSPCQGFSFAGKQLNFDDPRSKLFFEFVRLVKEAREINPDVVFLLENVRMKQEYQDIISDHLGVKPIEINSSLMSAQNRRRLYWTNIEGIEQPEDKEIVLSDIIESGVVDRDKSYCLDANYWKGGNLKQYFEKSRRQLVFEDLGCLDNYRKLTPVECERLQTLPDNYTAAVSDTQRYKMIGNGWTVDIITHILSYKYGKTYPERLEEFRREWSLLLEGENTSLLKSNGNIITISGPDHKEIRKHIEKLK